MIGTSREPRVPAAPSSQAVELTCECPSRSANCSSSTARSSIVPDSARRGDDRRFGLASSASRFPDGRRPGGCSPAASLGRLISATSSGGRRRAPARSLSSSPEHRQSRCGLSGSFAVLIALAGGTVRIRATERSRHGHATWDQLPARWSGSAPDVEGPSTRRSDRIATTWLRATGGTPQTVTKLGAAVRGFGPVWVERSRRADRREMLTSIAALNAADVASTTGCDRMLTASSSLPHPGVRYPANGSILSKYVRELRSGFPRTIHRRLAAGAVPFIAIIVVATLAIALSWVRSQSCPCCRSSWHQRRVSHVRGSRGASAASCATGRQARRQLDRLRAVPRVTPVVGRLA
jgi:hypothetical protein